MKHENKAAERNTRANNTQGEQTDTLQRRQKRRPPLEQTKTPNFRPSSPVQPPSPPVYITHPPTDARPARKPSLQQSPVRDGRNQIASSLQPIPHSRPTPARCFHSTSQATGGRAANTGRSFARTRPRRPRPRRSRALCASAFASAKTGDGRSQRGHA